MDGIVRITVDSYVMEYVMRCMYDTFLKIQKGLRVSISWHKKDDTVMITSTSRLATKDLHQALNRFFTLYNTLKRNLAYKYCHLGPSSDMNLYICNQLREKYRRIYIQNTNIQGEIKLWGFKSEIQQAQDFINRIYQKRLETPDVAVNPSRPDRTQSRLVHLEESSFHLPSLKILRERLDKRGERQEIKIPEAKKDVEDSAVVRDPSTILFSKSFERKLSRLQNDGIRASPPSRYSTTEIKRLQQVTQRPKKLSTFPKIIPERQKMIRTVNDELTEIQTPTGLTVSCCLFDATAFGSCEAMVTEISPIGRLSDEMSWIVAKHRSFEINRIIKLHTTLYGTMAPSKAIVTPGFRLPYTHLIHACPAIWESTNSKKSSKQLLNTYKNVLRVADRDINVGGICMPVLGRCPSAGPTFPENVALLLLNQSIVSCTKFGFRSLHHIRILCSRRLQLDYVTKNLFPQLTTLSYDPRYLKQQQRFFGDQQRNDYAKQNDQDVDWKILDCED